MSERKRLRDDAGKFISPKDWPTYRKVIVWDLASEGESVAHRWHATERDLDDIREMYGDDPQYEIQTEEY